MNSTIHNQIGVGSVLNLQGEARDFWRASQNLLGIASNFPDIFWLGKTASREYLDKFPDWETYIMIHCGGKEINCHSAFDPLRIWDTYPAVLNYLDSGALNAIREDNKELAAKFTGIISHIIGDTGQAAHVIDSKIAAPLFIRQGESYLLHTYLENQPRIVFPEHRHTPECLGNTQEEMEWMLLQRLVKLKNYSFSTIVPIMNALLEDDCEEAGRRASVSVGKCADLLTDVLHSLFLLSRNESPLLNDIKLIDVEASAWDCDGMFNFAPQINQIPGPLKNTPLPLDIGNGPEEGIALLPNLCPGVQGRRTGWVEYVLPENIYSVFSFRCGLNRAAERNDTSAVFEVVLNDKCAWNSGDISKNTLAPEINLSLKNIKKIRLQVSDARKDAMETKFFYPCFITPVIHRHALA